jgi:hypothetical protein
MEQFMHESGMHPDLFNKFGFIVKTAGNTMIIRLGKDLCVLVSGNLPEQGKSIRTPFFKLFNKGAGK